jgi:hypothetical protein
MPDYSDPKNRFLAWECDYDCEIEEEVNAAVASCIRELRMDPSQNPGAIMLRLQSDGQADDFVREISADNIRADLSCHDQDIAEQIAAFLISRFEEMAAELRAAKGTFGKRKKTQC